MFCMKCGALLPDDANFCFKCGCDLRNLSQSPGMDFSAVKVGDYVKFGRYPQNNGYVKEPIEWLVLEVNGNEALLISRYSLDCKEYHHEFINITWEYCDLREWLNNYFLKMAFSGEEQLKIKLSDIVNNNNWKYGTRGGNNTQDRVFCLSLAEAEQYFKNDSERQCRPTAHTRRGAWVDDSNGCCWWWLRSPGVGHDIASCVLADGELGPFGSRVSTVCYAVRPALRLILNL